MEVDFVGLEVNASGYMALRAQGVRAGHRELLELRFILSVCIRGDTDSDGGAC